MLTPLVLLALLLVGAASARPLKRYDLARIQSGRDGLCLTVGGITSKSAAGAAVYLEDCKTADRWSLDRGSGAITYSNRYGTVALDAGPNPANNGGLTVQDKVVGEFQQTWAWTDDDRIAIFNGKHCLDVADGDVLQIYLCTTGNTNQIFKVTLEDGSTPPPKHPTTTSSSPTPTETSIPSGTVYPDPAAGGGRRIHPKDRQDLCVTILGGDPHRDPANGTQVALAYCLDLNDANSRMQLWDIGCPGTTDKINIHGGGVCLADGTEELKASDGSPIVVRACNNGAEQQIWTFGDDGQICTDNGQCLNIKQESRPGSQSPTSSLRDLQSWRTYGDDPNSLWFLAPYTQPGPHNPSC